MEVLIDRFIYDLKKPVHNDIKKWISKLNITLFKAILFKIILKSINVIFNLLSIFSLHICFLYSKTDCFAIWRHFDSRDPWHQRRGNPAAMDYGQRVSRYCIRLSLFVNAFVGSIYRISPLVNMQLVTLYLHMSMHGSLLYNE